MSVRLRLSWPRYLTGTHNFLKSALALPDPNGLIHKTVVHPLLNRAPRLTAGSWLGPGSPTTPKRFPLLLLPSGPDKVRGLLPRRTQTSSLLAFGRLR